MGTPPLPWEHVPILDHSLCEEVLCNIQCKPSLVQLETVKLEKLFVTQHEKTHKNITLSIYDCEMFLNEREYLLNIPKYLELYLWEIWLAPHKAAYFRYPLRAFERLPITGWQLAHQEYFIEVLVLSHRTLWQYWQGLLRLFLNNVTFSKISLMSNQLELLYVLTTQLKSLQKLNNL